MADIEWPGWLQGQSDCRGCSDLEMWYICIKLNEDLRLNILAVF